MHEDSLDTIILGALRRRERGEPASAFEQEVLAVAQKILAKVRQNDDLNQNDRSRFVGVSLTVYNLLETRLVATGESLSGTNGQQASAIDHEPRADRQSTPRHDPPSSGASREEPLAPGTYTTPGSIYLPTMRKLYHDLAADLGRNPTLQELATELTIQTSVARATARSYVQVNKSRIGTFTDGRKLRHETARTDVHTPPAVATAEPSTPLQPPHVATVPQLPPQPAKYSPEWIDQTVLATIESLHGKAPKLKPSTDTIKGIIAQYAKQRGQGVLSDFIIPEIRGAFIIHQVFDLAGLKLVAPETAYDTLAPEAQFWHRVKALYAERKMSVLDMHHLTRIPAGTILDNVPGADGSELRTIHRVYQKGRFQQGTDITWGLGAAYFAALDHATNDHKLAAILDVPREAVSYLKGSASTLRSGLVHIARALTGVRTEQRVYFPGTITPPQTVTPEYLHSKLRERSDTAVQKFLTQIQA